MSELYTDGQNSLSTPDNASGLLTDTGVSGCRNIQDISFVVLVLNLRFLILCLYGDAVTFVGNRLFLSDGNGRMHQAAQGRRIVKGHAL